MSHLKTKGNITISRPSNFDGTDVIRIVVRDEKSRVTFLELEIDPALFAMSLTGRSEQECNFELYKTEFVGKTKVTEKRQLTLPFNSYDKEQIVSYMKENCQEEGWSVNYYIGSQNSVVYISNTTVVNYHVYKYI